MSESATRTKSCPQFGRARVCVCVCVYNQTPTRPRMARCPIRTFSRNARRRCVANMRIWIHLALALWLYQTRLPTAWTRAKKSIFPLFSFPLFDISFYFQPILVFPFLLTLILSTIVEVCKVSCQRSNMYLYNLRKFRLVLCRD